MGNFSYGRAWPSVTLSMSNVIRGSVIRTRANRVMLMRDIGIAVGILFTSDTCSKVCGEMACSSVVES